MKKAKTYNSIFKTILRWLACITIMAVLSWYSYLYAGRLLCRIAISRLGELTNTNITAGSIIYQANGSVFINEFVIKPLNAKNDDTDIFRAKKVFASFDKSSLFLFSPSLKTIDVNEFALNVIYDVNTGLSNLSDFTIKPSKGSSRKVPDINLQDGIIQYVKIINGHKDIFLSIPVEADFGSDERQPEKYNFNIKTATMSSGYGQSHLKGSWQPGSVILTGGIASLRVPDLRMACLVDVLAAELKYDKDENYTMALSIKDMKSLLKSEPNGLALDMPPHIKKFGFITALQEFFDWYNPIGTIDINLKMSGNLNALADSKVKGTVKCKDASINYIDFRYAVDHLNGNIDFTQDGLTLNNVIGKHGNSDFSFNGWFRNFGPDEEYSVDITSDSLPLEDDLYKALSKKEQEFWSAFSPVGNTTVDLHFEDHPHSPGEMLLKLGLLDVNAKYKNFPYPLRNLTGRLVFNGNKILVQDVVSRNCDTQIALNGEILNGLTDAPSFNISIGINNILLDSTLESSLQEDQKKLYRMLAPIGLTSGLIQVTGSDSGDTDYIADLDFNDASIKFSALNKPVSGIRAHAVFTRDLIAIRDLSGQYGDIPVSISGLVAPDLEKQFLYDVSVNMEKVKLNDNELYSFAPDSIKKIISRFQPDGSVDLSVDLKKDNLVIPASYSANVKYLDNSIKLKEVPYPVTGLTGSMKIDSDKIILNNISATLDDNNQSEPNRTKIFLKGEIELADGEMSQAKLRISAKNVIFNEKFRSLLPLHCQDLYKTLQPRGKFDIDVQSLEWTLPAASGSGLVNNDSTEVTPGTEPDEQLTTSHVTFDSSISLGGCTFVISNKPAKLDSTLQVHGEYVLGNSSDSARWRTIQGGFRNCSIIIDNANLNILGKTISSLKTQISYDPNEQKWFSDYLLADLYGGRATGNVEFIQKEGSPTEYVLQTAFDNVDLKRFLSDRELSETQNNTPTSGKMSGSLDLYSQLDPSVSRLGAFRVTIRDMQIGKMSVLANLLQVVNLNEPSDYAFDNMFIDAYIKRNSLVVEKLDMSGKSVAFYGSGAINLSNGLVDMSLIARGHRLATDDPSVLASLTEGLGQAVVRMDVTGDFQNIKVATRTLPVIEGTLQILGTIPSSNLNRR